MPCRLLILDDHLLLTQSLARLLAEQPNVQVLAQFSTGEALLPWLATASPSPADVLLLDLHLPGIDGLTLLPQLRQRWPALRVLVFSTATAPELIEQVKAAGASGFVPKSADADQLLAAIWAIHAGGTAFPKPTRAVPPTPADSGLLRLHRLSARERDIIGLVRAGLTTRQIAQHLNIAEFTVSTHRRNILHKLELHSVAALLQFAHEHGL